MESSQHNWANLDLAVKYELQIPVYSPLIQYMAIQGNNM